MALHWPIAIWHCYGVSRVMTNAHGWNGGDPALLHNSPATSTVLISTLSDPKITLAKMKKQFYWMHRNRNSTMVHYIYSTVQRQVVKIADKYL
jgi:hypothetical protein